MRLVIRSSSTNNTHTGEGRGTRPIETEAVQLLYVFSTRRREFTSPEISEKVRQVRNRIFGNLLWPLPANRNFRD